METGNASAYSREEGGTAATPHDAAAAVGLRALPRPRRHSRSVVADCESQHHCTQS
jgi:hypothetical protein